MIIKGRLNLSSKNDDYIMFYSGRSINISKLLDTMLMDNICMYVRNTYTDEVLFNEEGELIKNRISPYYYLYHVNKQDLDSILWDNVGNRLMINIENVNTY